MRTTVVGLPVVAMLLGGVAGCSLMDARGEGGAGKPGERVPIRFHLATDKAEEGWQVVQDEYGHPLYIDPTPALIDVDIADAGALLSDERSIVVLYFRLMASARLERLTADNVGKRLAVFVDNRLVVSPTIARSVTEGALAIDAGLSREQVSRIVRGYARPATGQEW